jgi:hypothetical protein
MKQIVCPFCQQLVSLVDTYQYTYKCPHHKYPVTIYRDDNEYMFTINEIQYKNRCYYINYGKIPQLFFKIIANKPIRTVVLELSQCPMHITPDNIDDKLSILLTFS